MTYGEIKTQFLGLMNRTDLRASTALQTTFLQQGISRVARTLRVPAMEKSIDYVVGASFSGIPMPNDFLQLINIEVANSTEVYTLTRGQLSRIKTLALQAGTPRKYARQGGKLLVGPAPSEDDVIRLDYYSDEHFSELTEDADTSIMTDVAWDAILYAALCAAGDYWDDKRLARWEARYSQIMDDLDAQGDNDELSADAAVGPAYTYPED